MLFRKILISTFFLSLVAGPLAASGIVLTEISVHPKNQGPVQAKADLVLNGALCIEDVELVKVSGQAVLKFPEYRSPSGRPYPQIKIRDQQLYQQLLSAVEQASVKPPQEAPALEFKITQWKPTSKKSSRKVNAEVTFNEDVSVIVGVMEGRFGPWIAWPSRPSVSEQGAWKKQIFLSDKSLQNQIESALVARYQGSKK